MKKLFYALMVVAASLVMVSCEKTTGEPDPTPAEKEFYGLTFDEAYITNVGENQFAVVMYDLSADGKSLTHKTAAYITATATDGVIPEGSYEIAEGEVVDNQYLTGSWYMNLSEDAGYDAVLTEGELEVKHTADGYRLTLWADGYNIEDGTAVQAEVRYEGAVTIGGNVVPVENQAFAIYCGLYEGVPYWIMQLYTTENLAYQIYFNTTSDVFEEGIPTGNYPFNYSFAAGNCDASYIDETGSYNGSLLLILNEEGNKAIGVRHLIAGGYVNLTNNGDNYTVDILYYNQDYVPYVVSFEGEVITYDDSASSGGVGGEDYAEAAYYGADEWLMWLGNAQTGLCFVFDLYNVYDTPFEQGLVSGTYTVANTCAEQTIYPGTMDEEYYIYPSFILSYDQEDAIDLIVDGTMELVNHGDGTYTISLDLVNEGFADDLEGYLEWTYEGNVDLYDVSEQGVAPHKVPYKSAAKPAQIKPYKSKLNHGKTASYQNLALSDINVF